jgi:hypothetical protein
MNWNDNDREQLELWKAQFEASQQLNTKSIRALYDHRRNESHQATLVTNLGQPGGASPRVRAQMQVDILKMIKDIEDELDLQMNKDLAEAEIQKIKMNVDTTLALKKAGLPSNGLD